MDLSDNIFKNKKNEFMLLEMSAAEVEAPILEYCVTVFCLNESEKTYAEGWAKLV